jgi:hypothetical protein
VPFRIGTIAKSAGDCKRSKGSITERELGKEGRPYALDSGSVGEYPLSRQKQSKPVLVW